MGLFRKRGAPAMATPSPASEVPPDPRRSHFDALVVHVLGEHNLSATVEGEYAVAPGRRLWLGNIQRLCEAEELDRWPEIVRGYLGTVLDGIERDLDDLDDAELHALTYLRLMGGSAAEIGPAATDLADGAVMSVLAVDGLETISIPSAGFWEARGGIERWREVGRRNLLLLSLTATHEDAWHAATRDGQGAFTVVRGESFFVGSTPLVVEEVIAGGDGDVARGCLVAMPHRHAFAFRTLEQGAEDHVQALTAMAEFAWREERERVGPISPDVFWVRSGRWRRLTARGPDGEKRLLADDEILAVLSGR